MSTDPTRREAIAIMATAIGFSHSGESRWSWLPWRDDNDGDGDGSSTHEAGMTASGGTIYVTDERGSDPTTEEGDVVFYV